MGITLDNPTGKNNGTVGGHTYFECKPLHGAVLRCCELFHVVTVIFPAVKQQLWDFSPKFIFIGCLVLPKKVVLVMKAAEYQASLTKKGSKRDSKKEKKEKKDKSVKKGKAAAVEEAPPVAAPAPPPTVQEEEPEAPPPPAQEEPEPVVEDEQPTAAPEPSDGTRLLSEYAATCPLVIVVIPLDVKLKATADTLARKRKCDHCTLLL